MTVRPGGSQHHHRVAAECSYYPMWQVKLEGTQCTFLSGAINNNNLGAWVVLRLIFTARLIEGLHFAQCSFLVIPCASCLA